MKGIIAFVDTVHEVLENRLTQAGYHCIDFTSKSFEDLEASANDFTGIVIRSRFPMERSFLAKCSQLKWLARSGAGLENIDLNACNELGITVYSSPEGNQQAVAEHALGMLLNMLNKIIPANLSVSNGNWERELHRGKELFGRSVGIIGYGHMGHSFAQLLKAFSCKIYAYDKYKTVEEEGIIDCSLAELKQNAEIISLHLPQSPETQHYIDAKFISDLQHPIYLINTARGRHVDSKALLDGIASKKILGAALDVLEFESSSFGKLDNNSTYKKLIDNDRIIITPHVAGWTEESYFKLSNVLADKILAE
jgi:D-3-phosphoglycerate dehydrogenase